MSEALTDREIRTASAIIGIALERLGIVDEDRADAIMGKMLEVYEPGMTVDDLIAEL